MEKSYRISKLKENIIQVCENNAILCLDLQTFPIKKLLFLLSYCITLPNRGPHFLSSTLYSAHPMCSISFTLVILLHASYTFPIYPFKPLFLFQLLAQGLEARCIHFCTVMSCVKKQTKISQNKSFALTYTYISTPSNKSEFPWTYTMFLINIHLLLKWDLVVKGFESTNFD